MLLDLRIENLLLIERAELRLGPGLNAITGETGAGKTVLAHALDLLLGGKPRPGIVRPGASEAYVEGGFTPPPGLMDDPALADLRERLPDSDEEILLGRRVGVDGRTRAFVQGRSASAGDLRELGGRLLSFYGQHEHRKLTVSSAQLELLDGFAGADHLRTRERLAECHGRVRELRDRLDQLRERAATRARDLDLLSFEIDEIEAVGPTEEEEESLAAERSRHRQLEGLQAAASGGAEAIAPEAGEGPGAAALLAGAERLADAVRGADAELDALADRLRGARLELEDLGTELRRCAEGLEAEPGRLEQIEERLAEIERLKRKHGGSVAAVLDHAARCREERERLIGAEAASEELEAALGAARAEEERLAAAVSEGRRRAAPVLSDRLRHELAELAMAGAAFAVELPARPCIGPNGAEGVEFLIAPNPGVPATPIRQTASGGELSRIMLALMSVANAGAGSPATLVFDEVDAGIGGQTARAVGERLRRLAADRQVLCITHLPQIASLADRHFRLSKSSEEELARAVVERLDDGGVVEELCRMLGADTTDAGARRHAEELLAAA